MKPHLMLQTMMAILWFCTTPGRSWATITQLNSPSDLSGATTINFEGYSAYTVANTLYQSQGITFTRDDGQGVFIYDWALQGRTTTSPSNVLATVSGPGVSPYVTYLNVLSSSPLFAMGAYFGNDQDGSDFATIRMSAYGLTGNFLGSVEVAANNNTSVDQFIGLSSTVPVGRVRFDNLNSGGTQSAFYSVVIDDLMFAPVPEPSTVALFLAGLAVMVSARRRGLTRNNA